MMLGGANFVVTRRQARPRLGGGVDVLQPGGVWPVRWTSRGCSLWLGRDGAVVPEEQLCQCKTRENWAWLFTTKDYQDEYFDATNHSATMEELLTAFGSRMSIPGTGRDVLVMGKNNYIEGIPQQCYLNNPGEDFLVPPGFRPPNPTYAGQKCYLVERRCLRLLLVQNAKWKGTYGSEEKCFDFSSARVRWLDHKFETSKRKALKCERKDPDDDDKTHSSGYTNGERPLYYAPGVGENLAQVHTDQGGYCGSWIISVDHDGLVDLSWEETVDRLLDDNLVPAFNCGVARDGVFVARYRIWKASPEASAESEKVLDALESQEGIGRRLFGDDEEDGDAMPFPYGTAFDMILACQTWQWVRRIGEKENANTRRGHWKHNGRGYLNTQVAGYIYQLSPSKPA